VQGTSHSAREDKVERKQIHARPLAYRGVPLKSVVPCSLSNELDGNVPELVIVRDNAYLEVAQAIQFVRTREESKSTLDLWHTEASP
jgi:hypothetical protein